MNVQDFIYNEVGRSEAPRNTTPTTPTTPTKAKEYEIVIGYDEREGFRRFEVDHIEDFEGTLPSKHLDELDYVLHYSKKLGKVLLNMRIREKDTLQTVYTFSSFTLMDNFGE